MSARIGRGLGTTALRNVVDTSVSTADSATAVLPAVPAGKFWYVLAASAHSNQANLEFSVELVSGSETHGLAASMTGSGTAVLAGMRVPVPRSFVMKDGDVLQARSNTATAGGNTITISARYIELDYGDEPPLIP